MVDAFVWEQVLDGIRDARARVCYATWKDLYAFVYERVQNHPEAEAILQEAYARLFRLAPRLRGQSGDVEGILLAIAEDVAEHGFRGGRTRVTRSGPDLPALLERARELAAALGPDAEARCRQAVRAALMRLPQDQRTLVTSRVRDGLPLREGARLTGRTEAEARTLLQEGLAGLAQALNLGGAPSDMARPGGALPAAPPTSPQLLDRYISDLNRDCTPQAHRRHRADPQGLYAAARAVKALREFAGARRGFQKRLQTRLGTPVAVTRLVSTTGMGIAVAILGLGAVMLVNLVADPWREYEAEQSMVPRIVASLTVTVTVTDPSGAPAAPGILPATWEAKVPAPQRSFIDVSSWYAADPASGSVVVRSMAQVREAGLTVITPGGELLDLADSAGHPIAFAHNAAGYAYVAYTPRESGGADRHPYLNVTWLSPDLAQLWQLNRKNSDPLGADLPARLSLEANGAGLLYRGFVPRGPGAGDHGGFMILRVDASDGLKASAPVPAGPQPWAVDWDRQLILVAEPFGSRVNLSLLGLETLKQLTDGSVSGRLSGDPSVVTQSGNWWLAAAPNVYLIAPDLSPVFTLSGQDGRAKVGFALAPTGWCAVWTDTAIALVGPHGQVAWNLALSGEGAGRPLTAAVAPDGSVVLVAKESDQAPPAGASRLLILELIDGQGHVRWSEIVEDRWMVSPVASFVTERQAMAVWGNGLGRALDVSSEAPTVRALQLDGVVAYERAVLMADGRHLLLESREGNRVLCYDLLRGFPGD